MSHDIRGAMSDVIGGLRLVDMGVLEPDTRAQLERVRSSGEVLARLVEEILSWANEGEDAPRRPGQRLNLGRFLHDLDSRWTGRAVASGLRFRMTIADTVPSVVGLDRVALERILGNLISNALKYTDRGEVQLDISLLPSRDLQFRVLDQGPGFSDAALALLFEMRGRPDNAPKPGTGLGLHIAKELSDDMGGRLMVANRAGGGALVSLSIPDGVWTTPDTAPAQSRSHDLSGKHILVAEDNETNQILTTQMLEALGATSEIAVDGVAALDALDQRDFDLALIDIEMPRLNGIEVIRTIRTRNDAKAKMPLIALTAYVLRSNREAIYQAGSDAIIAKPIMSLESFAETLAQHLGAPTTSDELEASNVVSMPDRSRFDRLLEIAGTDGARELLSRLTADLERVRDNLCLAIPRLDQSMLRAETHVLISLAGAVGADRLHTLASTLNAAAHRMDECEIVTLGSEAKSRIDDLLRVIEREAAERIPTV
ncbi:response regulator [Dinoroseobacter shibae]|uniref:response regulator n=1 Tax=Dinoroseobacter shibae TaxID=215813 RepID=UPI000316E4E6|nr:response regulator [Dinoroseobacter shibae]URF47513.1 response regulator [Dinoroseobacter shibae]URF51824.1 response regulator [Dinoroseobacter shibae]